MINRNARSFKFLNQRSFLRMANVLRGYRHENIYRVNPLVLPARVMLATCLYYVGVIPARLADSFALQNYWLYN